MKRNLREKIMRKDWKFSSSIRYFLQQTRWVLCIGVCCLIIAGCAPADKKEYPQLEIPPTPSPMPTNEEVKPPPPVPNCLLKICASGVVGQDALPELARNFLAALGGEDSFLVYQEDEIIHQAQATFPDEKKPQFIQFHVQGTMATSQKLLSGRCDAAFSSDRFEAGSNSSSFESNRLIALDALVFIVHKDNPIKSLSKEQIVQIVTGAVSDWSEISQKAGKFGTIQVYAPEQNSGLYDAFDRYVLNGTQLNVSVLPVSDDREAIGAVAKDKAGIAVISFAHAENQFWNQKTKAKILKVSSSKGAASFFPNHSTILAMTYPFTYPIYLHASTASAETVRQFVSVVDSESGRNIIEEVGNFVAIEPVVVLQRALDPKKDSERYSSLKQHAVQVSTNVNFSSTSEQKQAQEIQQVADFLKRCSDCGMERHILVLGFTDVDNARGNQKKSEERAWFVAEKLRRQRIPILDEHIVGFGQNDPAFQGNDKKNRRAEVWIVNPGVDIAAILSSDPLSPTPSIASVSPNQKRESSGNKPASEVIPEATPELQATPQPLATPVQTPSATQPPAAGQLSGTDLDPSANQKETESALSDTPVPVASVIPTSASEVSVEEPTSQESDASANLEAQNAETDQKTSPAPQETLPEPVNIPKIPSEAEPESEEIIPQDTPTPTPAPILKPDISIIFTSPAIDFSGNLTPVVTVDHENPQIIGRVESVYPISMLKIGADEIPLEEERKNEQQMYVRDFQWTIPLGLQPGERSQRIRFIAYDDSLEGSDTKSMYFERPINSLENSPSSSQ